MPANFKRYWSSHIADAQSDICLNCGSVIDYRKFPAIMASRDKVNVNLSDDAKRMFEIFYFCPPCGTDLEILTKLGMKTFMGINSGPSGDLEALIDGSDDDGPIEDIQ